MPTPPPGPPPSSRSDTLRVAAFGALVYAQHDPAHLSRVSSPAYDLVTAQGRAGLAAADPHNVVRLILPGVDDDRPTAADPAATAASAAGTLTAWRASGVLTEDAGPALWLYRMLSADGSETTGWLAAVAVPEDGSRAVLPHEDTYAPAVEGRRLLLAATRTDLEPIVLAHDPDADVAAVADRVATGRPTMTVADPDGVRHTLWRVEDADLLDRVVSGLGRTGAVIADGHHRFAAARAHAASGAPGSGSVLALLTPMGPGGLRLRAIHRVVPGLELTAAGGAAATGFTVTRLPVPAEGVVAAVHEWTRGSDRGRMLLSDGHDLLELSDPTTAVRDRVPTDQPASWRALDVVLAHHGLVGALWGLPDDPAHVLVAHDPDEALRSAQETAGVALLLRSPTPDDVAAVARSGARMPRKSTLFVPKPRTGLVLRPH